MKEQKKQPKKYQQPKPKMNPLITDEFQKNWWRHKIVTANKKEQK